MKRRVLRNQPRLVPAAERQLRAVGAYIFAGGFTVGVKQAGFEVLAHLEGNSYGVSTAKLNFPELDVRYGPEHWNLDDFRDQELDLIYGNPPCAAWSVNNPNSHVADRWRADPRVACTLKHFSLLEELRPKVWLWESVPQAPIKGKELVDELTARALKLGYAVTQVFHDARWLGAPQARPRWMLVCHRIALSWPMPNWAPAPSPDQVLAEVTPRGSPAFDSGQRRGYGPKLIAKIKPGERLRKFWERTHPEAKRTIKANGHTKGRPGFGHVRLRSEGIAPATVGYAFLHPTEHRFCTLNEVQAIAGFPDEFEFDGLGAQNGYALELNLIARGVCPPVGRWFASAVAASLRQERPLLEFTAATLDFSQPPKGE